MAVVIVWAWLLAIAAAAATEPWPSPGLLVACLVAAAAGALALARAGGRRPWFVLAPLVAGTLVVTELGAPRVDLAGYPMVALWLNLTTICIGLLLPVRQIAVAMPITVAAVGAIEWSEHQGHPIHLETSALLSVLTIAVTVGMLAAVPVVMLRRTASSIDSVAGARAASAAEAARLDARRTELRRIGRILHDTVLNTLGAVARLDTGDPAVVAARCAHDLTFLRSVDRIEPDEPAQLLDSIGGRAMLLGVSLDVVAPDPGPLLPTGIGAVLEGAAWEALNNVTKHARERRAVLRWDWDGRNGRLVVSDPGPGADGSRAWVDAARTSLEHRCAEAGIRADITSNPRQATVVTLRWTGTGLPARAEPREPGLPLERMLAQPVVQVCIVVGAAGVLGTVALPAGTPRWTSLLGVLLIAALGWHARMVAVGRARWRIPVAAYPLAALVGTWLPGLGQAGCLRVGSGWWGTLVGIAVGIAAILLDGRRRVALAAAAGLVGGNLLITAGLGPGAADCGMDVLVDTLAALAGLAGVWAFRRAAATAWATGRAEQALLATERARAEQADEAVRTRRELLGMARQVAEPVMAGLAARTLDPREGPVRAEAARAEGTLRALAAVPVSDPGGAGRALTQVVLAAHARRIALQLDLNADLEQNPATVARGAAMLEEALAACPSGSSVRITVLQGEDGLHGLVLITPDPGPPSAGPDPDLVARLGRSGWQVTEVGAQVLAEAVWVSS
jgi:signal transduction histidine kinase